MKRTRWLRLTPSLACGTAPYLGPQTKLPRLRSNGEVHFSLYEENNLKISFFRFGEIALPPASIQACQNFKEKLHR